MMQNAVSESKARVALKFGMLGSVVALYVSAIGMVEAFSERSLIGDSLSLGYVILAAGPVGAGILTARSMRDRGSRLSVLGSTFLSGAVSSSLLLVLLAVIVLIKMLVSAEPSNPK